MRNSTYHYTCASTMPRRNGEDRRPQGAVRLCQPQELGVVLQQTASHRRSCEPHDWAVLVYLPAIPTEFFCREPGPSQRPAHLERELRHCRRTTEAVRPKVRQNSNKSVRHRL